MTKDEVISLLRTTRSEQQWNDACDKIKQAFGGKYPDWWFLEVLASGLMAEISSTWESRR